jgi:RND family efflux transporter MFP subunit
MTRRALLLTLCTLVPLSACSQEKETLPEAVRPVLSTVVAPTASRALGFVGTVEPEFSANLAFRLLGRVVARDVEVGDLVTKGETLAALDPTALDLGVQAAKAEFSNAEAQFANASASEERQRLLLESKNTSQAVYDAAKQAMQAAQANVERARAALAKSQEQLGYARLFSDFDGVVTAVGAEVGQTVSPSQTIVTVARAGMREVVLDVPDRLVADLAADTRFDVTLQTLPSIRTQAKLREIAPQADSATRTRRLRLTLIDPPALFRLGSTVTVTRVTTIAAAIELPLSALLEADGKTKVWIVDPQASSVTTRNIEVSARTAGAFTVATGLEAGTRVVTAGAHSLREGQKVRIGGAVP